MNNSGASSTPTANPSGKKSKSSSSGGNDAIKVICRFRPPRAPKKDSVTSKAAKQTFTPDEFKLNVETGDIKYISDFQDHKQFKFDKVFGGDSTQAQVFDDISGTVDFVMDGFNGAVLAYGQTSAGKSWTMEGPSIRDVECQGVVPRCVAKLFEEIDKAASTIQFQIVVSYYEIYCEKVRDLLNPTQTNMKVRETKTDGFIVQDVTEVYCTDKDSVLRVIELGKTNRIAAPTLMNAESSRSHSIFSILVDQQDTASGRHKKGILYLVDLAGSEKVGKTGATGLRLEEAKNINSSLTSLGMVINALCDGAPHVPFRDSKLTMLLMEALGGNSKTTLIICCTPEHDHSPETLSTLRFGERAKHIKTNAKVNEELSVGELKVQLGAAKKEMATLVSVLAKTSQGIGEAIATVSVTGLVPIADTLKKYLAKNGSKGDGKALLIEDGTPLGGGAAAAAEEVLLSSPAAAIGAERISESDGTQERSEEEDAYDPSVSSKQPVKTSAEQLADLANKVTSLEEEVELEKLRCEKEHEMVMFKSTELAALQATIDELEEKLLKASLQAKRAQEAKIAAEELLSAANEAASASAAALERSRLTSSDVSPTPHQQARHNSLATDTEGPSSPTSAQQQHLTSTLSTISSASVEDAPGGTVTGLDLSPTEARSPLNTASAAASPTAATAASTSAVTSAAAATAAAKLELASASDSREFLIRLERELIATGTNFNPDGSCKRPGPQQQPRQSLGGDEEDPLKCFDAANAAGAGDAHRRASWDKNSAELMKLLNIDESELGKGSDSAGDSLYHSKEVYESHVRRLMVILDQEQQARLRVEDKLDEARQQILRQSAKLQAATSPANAKKGGFLQTWFGGGGHNNSGSSHGSTQNNNISAGQTATSALTSFSNLVADTISPGTNRRRESISGSSSALPTGSASAMAEENARRFNYSDREAALAETLEIAQERIMELVAEMESTQEAQNIVLETKESVLRSLARQNTHLAMERDALNQKVDALTAKTDQLSTLLRSVQQVQVQPLPPSLPPAAGSIGTVGAQSFRIGGNGSIQRFHSNARIIAPVDTTGGGASGGESSIHGGATIGGFGGMRTAPSFRMGGKPPITPTGTGLGQGFGGLTPVHNSGILGVASPTNANVPRTPFLFSGNGAIQRTRSNRVNSSPPVSVSPISASNGSSTNSSCEDLTVLDSSSSNVNTVLKGTSAPSPSPPADSSENTRQQDAGDTRDRASPAVVTKSKSQVEEDNVAVGIAVDMEDSSRD